MLPLKSHATDWEKPGFEPATPGLQDTGLSPTPQRLLYCILCKERPSEVLEYAKTRHNYMITQL